MEQHVDVHWADYPMQWPCIGEITDVYPKDHALNTTGKVTLYQVKALLQRPNMPVILAGGVPYMGQSAGWGSEEEKPLVKGQRVIVLFLEGDPQRPVIAGPFPYVGPKNTPALAQTSAQYPQTESLCNNVRTTVDKDGHVALQLAPQKDITIFEGGSILFRITWTGSAYEIHLGGISSLKRLMTEDMIEVFNTHTHVETGGTTNAPALQLNVGSHSTSTTKAK